MGLKLEKRLKKNKIPDKISLEFENLVTSIPDIGYEWHKNDLLIIISDTGIVTISCIFASSDSSVNLGGRNETAAIAFVVGGEALRRIGIHATSLWYHYYSIRR